MESKRVSDIDQLIQRFIQRKTSVDEEEILYNWIKDNPENRKYLFNEKDIWDSTKLGSNQLNQIEMNQWFELQNRIASRKMRISKITDAIKIAAIVIVALVTGWLARYLYSEETFLDHNVEMKTIEATKGQLKEIFLADGTHVWLNSDSKFSFPTRFNENNRKVELHGEAYFEVTANKEKPFFVKTENQMVKVVGTHFNICEYPESHIIETTLEEGKVKIITGNIIHDLLPGEQSSFNTETSKVRIGKADIEVYTTWKDGRYEFKNEPITKVFRIMERWWDVQINYPEEKLKNEQISGVLRRYKPLEQHLQVIKQIIPIDYKIEGDVINVNAK